MAGSVNNNEKLNMNSKRYPSRQKKLGPAPFASFDSFDTEELPDLRPSPGGDADKSQNKLPEIKEDGIRGGPEESDEDDDEEDEEEENRGRSQKPSRHHSLKSQQPSKPKTTFFPFTSTNPPISGPTSALQTPSTPRIDISCASSSTPPSDDSNSERLMFMGRLGLEDGTEDLRSSTEELPVGTEDEFRLEENAKLRKEREREREEQRLFNDKDDLLRRASHPANIFTRRTLSPSEEIIEVSNRKPSAHSLFQFDNTFQGKAQRAHSFGSADCQRPGAISSLSVGTTASGRRSSSPNKLLLETSFCGSKPIPTPSMDFDSPPKEIDLDELRRLTMSSSNNKGLLSSDSSFEGHRPPTTTMAQTTVQVHQAEGGSPGCSSVEGGPLSLPSTSKENNSPRRGSWRSNSPESPKSSSHWRPYSPRDPSKSPRPSSPPAEGEEPTQSKCAQNLSTSTYCQKPPDSPFKPISPDRSECVKGELGHCPSFEAQWDNFEPCTEQGNCHKSGGGGGEEREITTEMRIKEEATVQTMDALPIESKSLFLHGSSSVEDEEDHDDELPFVPALPIEKSSAPPIIPIKERKKLGPSMFATVPVSRPSYVKPPNPASLNDYIASTNCTSTMAVAGSGKPPGMKINLPKEDSQETTGSPSQTPKKKHSVADWSSFMELGLRSSPKEIRQRLSLSGKSGGGANNYTTDEYSSYHSDSSGSGDEEIVGSNKRTSRRLEKTVAVLGGGGASEPGSRGVNGSGDEEESECLLKLPNAKVPFANDLDVDRNSVSQGEGEMKPTESLGNQQDEEEEEEDDEDDEVDLK